MNRNVVAVSHRVHEFVRLGRETRYEPNNNGQNDAETPVLVFDTDHLVEFDRDGE